MRRTTLTTALLTALLAVIVIVVLVNGGSAKTNQKGSLAGSVLSVRHTSLGEVLVGANGRTLYLFEGDQANHSNLSAAGRMAWPPFTVTNTPKAENGIQAGKIGTIAASSGGRQVTYAGHPLYYFVGDTKAGTTHGQDLNDFGARWYVVASSGNAIKSSVATSAATTTPSTTSTSSSTGGGYGY